MANESIIILRPPAASAVLSVWANYTIPALCCGLFGKAWQPVVEDGYN